MLKRFSLAIKLALLILVFVMPAMNVPIAQAVGANTLTSITMNDPDGDGKIQELIVQIDNPAAVGEMVIHDNTGWLVTDGGNTVDISSVVVYTDTGLMYEIQIILDTNDADLLLDTANSDLEVSYTQQGANAGTEFNDTANTQLVAIATGDGSAELTEVDNASPIVVSVTPATSAVVVDRTTDIVVTFSEAMNTTFVEGTEFTFTPDPGAFSAAVWTVSDTVVTLSHTSSLLCGLNSLYIVALENADVATSPNTLSSSAESGLESAFTVVCSSGSTGPSEPLTYTLDVTSPTDAQHFNVGDTMNITWEPGGTGSVGYANLLYSADGGATHTVIEKNVVNNGSYNWAVPNIQTTKGTIRVELTDTAEVVVSDYMLGYFSVGTMPATPTSPTTGISPVTGLVENLTPVSAGNYIRGASFDTVYYVDGNNIRHPFMNALTYFTWESSFAPVKSVTDATLQTMALGKPMLPKPGVVLVKIESDPRVYAVEDTTDMFAPKLRWITSESLAESLYGANWADYVIDLPTTLFPRFVKGTNVELVSDITVNTSLLKKRSDLK